MLPVELNSSQWRWQKRAWSPRAWVRSDFQIWLSWFCSHWQKGELECSYLMGTSRLYWGHQVVVCGLLTYAITAFCSRGRMAPKIKSSPPLSQHDPISLQQTSIRVLTSACDGAASLPWCPWLSSRFAPHLSPHCVPLPPHAVCCLDNKVCALWKCCLHFKCHSNVLSSIALTHWYWS